MAEIAIAPGELAADEVHVWLARPSAFADEPTRQRHLALLSPDEREQQARFHFERDRELYLVAHALVRRVLSRHADVEPTAWAFERNHYGCPRIAPGLTARPLRFNLSHTRDLAAVAVALDRDVGVDVEDVTRPGETVSLADDFFAPPEARALRALPASDQVERFFAYWTLKESYIKARGMGLSIPLEQFAFDLADPARIRIAFTPPLDDDPARWHFERSRPTAQHALAVAAERRGDAPRVIVRMLDP